MRILVTGANGYLGQGVVKSLLNMGIEVVATDFTDDYIDKRADIRCCNLFEIENPMVFFGNPDVLLHMAWKDGFKHDSLTHITELPNHYLFIKKMIEGGLRHITVLGSMHEVGFWEGSIDSNTPCNPQSLYGIAKNALRQSTELVANRANIVFQWIRGFYIVGNSSRGCSVFSKIAAAAKDGKSEFPFTLGLNQFDFIEYDDFCEQVSLVVTQEEVNGIINCCSGRPMRLAERVEQFIKDNNFNIKLNYGAFPDRPYDSKAIWGNDDAIKTIIKRRQNGKNASDT